jgi:hypothetical protein
LLLERHVRDRGDLTVEQAVHELTGKLAARSASTTVVAGARLPT